MPVAHGTVVVVLVLVVVVVGLGEQVSLRVSMSLVPCFFGGTATAVALAFVSTPVLFCDARDPMMKTAVSSPPRPARAKRRRLSPPQRRAELIAATQRVVERVGLQRASAAAIVAEAGAAQGTFYRAFADIEDALLEVTRGPLLAITAAVRSLDFSEAKSPADVEAGFYRLYLGIAGELSRNTVLMREVLLAAPSMGGAVGKEVSELLRVVKCAVSDAVRRESGRPPFRYLDSRITVAAIMGMALGACQEAVEMGADFDLEVWAREMARFEAGRVVEPRLVATWDEPPRMGGRK